MSWEESVSGYIGGAAGILATHPLDTIRIQAQFVAGQSSTGELSYVGIAKEIWKESGILGFYRGVLPPVVLRGITMGINRWAYDFADRYYPGQHRYGRSWWLGFFAGAVTSIAETPIHLLKTRVQTGVSGDMKETLAAYFRLGRVCIKEEGFRSLMVGVAPSTILGAMSYGLFYVVYDEMLLQKYPAMVCGMVSAVLSWPLFYPLEVIRTRLQSTPMKTKWSQEFWTFRRGSEQLFTRPFSQWFPGLGMTLTRAVPRWGIVMQVHQITRNYLRHIND